MNQKIVIALFIVIVFLVIATFTTNNTAVAPEASDENINLAADETSDTPVEGVVVHPISHATFVLELGDQIIFNDPVGDPSAFAAFADPDIILLSDVHGDHLSTETLEAVVGSETALFAPQAVYDELSPLLRDQTTVLNNGDLLADVGNFLQIEALPMYNLPTEGPDYRHVKGRGNGYVLSYLGKRLYIAGDTEDIPEMRALENIDIAFVPMNLPYTMGIEQAAEGVAAFAPKVVYPYHYRGPDGLSDVNEFKRLVNEGNSEIGVRLLDWYPEAE